MTWALSIILCSTYFCTPLITHRFSLREIEEAYRIFENKLDGVIKVAIFYNFLSSTNYVFYKTIVFFSANA